MQIKEIQEYAQVRTKARAYLCYIMGRNISQTIRNGDIKFVLAKLDDFKKSIPKAKVVYALDSNGVQITDNISDYKNLKGIGKGENRSNRAYYYRTVEEHRCTLTDPYPSLISNSMVVTSSFPIYDEADNLLCIICVDITLENILKMVHPSSVDSVTGTMSKIAYTAFSLALSAVSLLLFVKGITSFLHFGLDFSVIEINKIFEATILLTLSLAIFDLVKAIFEEEVLGKEKKYGTGDTHQTMVRFLGSIIIALSIEALMLVFKFALTDPIKLQFAVYLIAGVSLLLISLSLYMKFSRAETKNTKQN
ncbi:MAG: PDC sensor domain-containing protein [Sulfurovum sp.]|uniref:PDC sensor domain-containing protein n=1 Tax=Sulfurovum sp. TaxID=1969726 RepID=UPI002867F8C9|nr:PDC sensor domain-containing protein [Sulfurovum sp.]MCO4845920.1 PDC sensor domain-containing protein [Sulfurovum sp.]